jgi:NOL1/NOP2/fmu family ribosome biogenesis protein
MEIDKSPFGEGCDGVPAFVGGEDSLCHTLRLWPHKVQGEGHFAALLTKAGEAGAYRAPAASGILKTVSEKELGEYRMFVKETFLPGKAPEGAYFTFGENLYLAPKGMPSLKGLKVMRPGLHIGEMKKNRFEPSHALALAVEPSAVKHVWNMKADDERVRAYLNGQTFPAEGEKGWYLICVDSYSIGWGKLAGGVMKNHYPKGLRH